MFTILIPCLRRGFLAAQLYNLSKQVFKDFTVLVMDGFYKEHAGQAFMQKRYPFKLIHVPLIENLLLAKRYDYSVKNNLVMLSPTFHFVLLSDTHVVDANFASLVYRHILHESSDSSFVGVFPSMDVDSAELDASNHTLKVDVSKVKSAAGWPDIAFVSNVKDFIYLLNGFDEILSVACPEDTFLVRYSRIKPIAALQVVAHVSHPKFRFTWHKEPCDRCRGFEERIIRQVLNYHEFMDVLRLDVDPEAVEQMIYFDKDLGCMMFQCGICGFGGPVSYREYMNVNESYCRAPSTALDGRAGRDLSKVYETMAEKCGNSLEGKLAFLKSSY